MASREELVPLAGSERSPIAQAHAVGTVAPDERIEVTVRVRRRTAASPQITAEALGATPPSQRHYLSREEFAEQHRADAADLATIEDFARHHGLVVVEASAARRSVVLSGTAQAL